MTAKMLIICTKWFEFRNSKLQYVFRVGSWDSRIPRSRKLPNPEIPGLSRTQVSWLTKFIYLTVFLVLLKIILCIYSFFDAFLSPQWGGEGPSCSSRHAYVFVRFFTYWTANSRWTTRDCSASPARAATPQPTPSHPELPPLGPRGGDREDGMGKSAQPLGARTSSWSTPSSHEQAAGSRCQTARTWRRCQLLAWAILTLCTASSSTFVKLGQRHNNMSKNRTPADRSRFKNSSWDQNKTVRVNFYEFKIPDSIPGFNPGIPGLEFFNREIPGLEKDSGIAILKLEFRIKDLRLLILTWIITIYTIAGSHICWYPYWWQSIGWQVLVAWHQVWRQA